MTGNFSGVRDAECEQWLFDRAAVKARAHFTEPSWQACWRTGVENLPVPDVAAALELAVRAVYIAESRVLARLKEQFEQGDDR
ncbi:MAG: hypothetical protein VB858_08055 [Planctomycetaceae bacterium]